MTSQRPPANSAMLISCITITVALSSRARLRWFRSLMTLVPCASIVGHPSRPLGDPSATAFRAIPLRQLKSRAPCRFLISWRPDCRAIAPNLASHARSARGAFALERVPQFRCAAEGCVGTNGFNRHWISQIPDSAERDMASNGQFAIVTGASTGIGLELARCCAKDGFDLLIAADEPEIEQAAASL